MIRSAPLLLLPLLGCSGLDALGGTETLEGGGVDAPAEDCLGTADVDGDGAAGCEDPDCAATCDADGDGAIDEALGGDDCDDSDAAVHPGHPEVCDDIDNNCDGLIDDEDPSLDPDSASWYRDEDQDGYGDPAMAIVQCEQPSPQVVDNGEDCDDTNPAVNPAAEEVCNGRDDNCDGLVDLEDPSVYCTCDIPFTTPSVAADVVFTDMLGTTTMTLTWDGTDYWSTSGGSSSGDRLARYDTNGVFLETFAPGLDFRAVFTKDNGAGPVYSRAYSSNAISEMTGTGSFTSVVTLSGGSLDSQASIAFDSTRREFIALNPSGIVDRWDEQGAWVGTVTLQGWGSQGSESSSPQGRGVAWACEHYLTYSDGLLSAWDSTTGARVSTVVLENGTTSFDGYYSLSVANDRVFLVDQAGGSWRGYPAF